jgi:putative acetyltransferase
VFTVAPDSPLDPDVQTLLSAHLAFANEHSPPEDIHALDVAGLLAENISFFSVRHDSQLLGVGALKQLDPEHAEVKSMHTAKAARGRGVGSAIFDHLLDTARARGCRRVSLETGTMEAFAPARALYATRGFVICPPFGQYFLSPNSVCMTLELDSE